MNCKELDITVCNLDRVHSEYFWNSKPVVSLLNQRCNVKKFQTYKDIPLSFLYWRNWFLVLLFYILVIWIFSITTLPLLFDMPARVHSTNVSLSMRNVKLYWINIDSFCAKHLKLVMFWTLVCTRTAEVCHTMLQILVNVKSMK